MEGPQRKYLFPKVPVSVAFALPQVCASTSRLPTSSVFVIVGIVPQKHGFRNISH
jgi:hypothetical protein